MRKKSGWLLQILILSAGLNIIFVAIFFYFMVHSNPLYFSYQPAKVQIGHERPPDFFLQLQMLGFEDLQKHLSDMHPVSHGYRICDFALGALVAYHDFDIVSALGRTELEKKVWVYEDVEFSLYPKLNKGDFRLIQNFLEEEQWPFTTKGLFKKIQAGETDTALIVQFCRSDEFVLIETLFSRTKLPIQKKVLLAMLVEGGWGRLENFVQKQKKASDVSDDSRRKLLLSYISARSKIASYLLLKSDLEFAIAELSDQQVVQLLNLLSKKTAEAIQFANAISESPRSSSVCSEAQKYLEDNQEEIAGRYTPRPGIGELRPVFRDKVPLSVDPSVHIIQPGESLWTISSKYQVPIELIMEVNHLRSTVIQPGKTLKIPR